MARKSKSADTPSATSGSIGINPERERQYRAEDALRTLTRADEIRRDAALMRDVKSHAKQQIKTVGRVLQRPKTSR